MTGRDTPELPSFYKHFNLSALIQLPVMTSLSLQFLKPKLFSLLLWCLQLDLIFLIQAVQFVFCAGLYTSSSGSAKTELLSVWATEWLFSPIHWPIKSWALGKIGTSVGTNIFYPAEWIWNAIELEALVYSLTLIWIGFKKMNQLLLSVAKYVSVGEGIGLFSPWIKSKQDFDFKLQKTYCLWIRGLW